MIFEKESKEEKAQIRTDARHAAISKQNTILDQVLRQDEIDATISQGQFEIISYIQGVDDEIVFRLEHELKNHVIINIKTREWKPAVAVIGRDDKGELLTQEVPPLLNDLGVRAVISAASPFLSRNMFNSNFAEERINMMLKRSCTDLHFDLIQNRIEYGLGDAPKISSLRAIMRLYKNYVSPGPHRALNDGERRNMRSFTKNVHTTNDSNEKKKTGFFGG